jgi:hypothetical protein
MHGGSIAVMEPPGGVSGCRIRVVLPV